ncbi:sigma-70 family RNA polymerase sigma factor [Pedobacter frigoris]|uniref:Sigma-70 family RNA polymerase sigma factor n=1 Tax=Pedobacter frigoris TaxID=2571272 RepID=A0A4U1CHZ6_9SPHI|nr:sigma-70 family RNA polymerase sigma factor [Pedobacter frigoris]TKC06997.1 sigma-70 family RNA polymerase sigma factor [Pedobacter frigoris]
MRALRINQLATTHTAILDRYLAEIGKYELILPDEEVLLGQKIKNGDKSALDKLVIANLKFVVSVAKRYQNNGLALEDLISEGNKGLIRAAQSFDPTRGFKFISFAVWSIRQSIMRAISEKRRIVRLPGNQIVAIAKLFHADGELEQRLERKPTTRELADYMAIDEIKIADYFAHSAFAVSLDREFEIANGKIGSMLDLIDKNEIKSDTQLIYESDSIQLERLLNTLKKRERLIVKLSYGIGAGYGLDTGDVAEKVGLSKERVRQLRMKAIKKLKKVAKVEMFY